MSASHDAPESAELGARLFDVEAISLPDEEKGEDAFLISSDFVAVADGSTPLRPGGSQDSRAFAERALNLLSRDPDQPLAVLFERALTEMGPPVGPLSERASCTVGMIRAHGSLLEVAALGDCGIVIAASGEQHVITDQRIERFDAQVAERIGTMVAEGKNVEAAIESVRPELIANRDAANQPDTYWLFAGDPRAAGEIVTASVQAEELSAALLYTDGFGRLVRPFGVAKDERQLLELSLSRGLSALGEELREIEGRESSMATHPRLSVSDDATAVLLRSAQ